MQTVPLCAECPPTLVVLARTHKGAVENISVEVSSINESSMEDNLGQYAGMPHTMCSCRMWTELGLNRLTHYLSCSLLDVTGAGELFGRWNKARWYRFHPQTPFGNPGHKTKIYASTLNQSTAVVSGIVASCNCPRLAQATSDRIVLPRAYNLSHLRRYSWFAYTLWEKKLVIICSRLQNYRLLRGTFCTKRGQPALG